MLLRPLPSHRELSVVQPDPPHSLLMRPVQDFVYINLTINFESHGKGNIFGKFIKALIRKIQNRGQGGLNKVLWLNTEL